MTLDEGDFPWIEPGPSETELGPGWVLRADEAGEVQFFGFEDPYEPLDVRVTVRALDCDGALSDPITLRISDPGRPLPDGNGAGDLAVPSAESGCSLSPTHSTRSTKQGPTTVAAPLWVGLCAAIMAARRASSIATRPKARR
jgi:hypothetical protein